MSSARTVPGVAALGGSAPVSIARRMSFRPVSALMGRLSSRTSFMPL
jgi:hypothetical protein